MPSAYVLHGKRLFDLALTIPGLIVVAPLMVGTAVLIRSVLGSPVLFIQSRPGLRGEPFHMFKFRTMTDERDASGELLPDADRLNWLGSALRKSSIDELPELINVLKGEMSLVGPRPLLMRYLGLYSQRQARRHEVKPGITGWAQVNGRNSLTWERKFELDVFYVDNVSLELDIRILALTVLRLLRREDVQFTDGWSMSYFAGSDGQASSEAAALGEETG